MTNSEIIMIALTAVIAVSGVVAACIFNNQLTVMQGQLDEMKSTGKQTEAVIEINKKLVDAAKESAEAAKKSADTTIALERPYLYINAIKLIKSNGADDPNPHIEYSFVNLGRVPGFIIMIYVECFVGDTLPQPPVYHQSKFMKSANAIGPGAIMGTDTKPIMLPKCTLSASMSEAELSAVKAGTKKIFFQSFVLYKGALNIEYLRGDGNRCEYDTGNCYPDGGTSYNYETTEAEIPALPAAKATIVP